MDEPTMRVGEKKTITIGDREFEITKQSGYVFMQAYGVGRKPLCEVYKDLIVTCTEMSDDEVMNLDTFYFMPLAMAVIDIHEKPIQDF